METKPAVQTELPEELSRLAETVSTEKKNEVLVVLSNVFEGVSKMRKQLDLVEVVDHNDKNSMKLARQIRLSVRDERIDAEKVFDAKRAEVQNAMLSFKTEDQLWLKSKQTMQILTKEIEELAKWKETTADRYEKEQRDLKVQQRMILLSEIAPHIQQGEVENISDETFDSFYLGLKNTYEAEQEAHRKAEDERLERERKAELHAERKELLIPYWSHLRIDYATLNFGEISQDDFNIIMNNTKQAKAKFDEEQEAIRIENERLKKEAEEKERKAEAERKERERIESERKAKEESERKKLEEEKWLAEEKQRKLEAELEEKRKAEAAEAKRKADEEARKLAEEEAAKHAELNKGDAERVADLIADLNGIKAKYAFKSAKNKKMFSDVQTLIDKIVLHIQTR